VRPLHSRVETALRGLQGRSAAPYAPAGQLRCRPSAACERGSCRSSSRCAVSGYCWSSWTPICCSGGLWASRWMERCGMRAPVVRTVTASWLRALPTPSLPKCWRRPAPSSCCQASTLRSMGPRLTSRRAARVSCPRPRRLIAAPLRVSRRREGPRHYGQPLSLLAVVGPQGLGDVREGMLSAVGHSYSTSHLDESQG
jgi:hypothetical protein